MQRIIEIENGVTRMPEWRLAKPVNFTLDEGEHIAIVGGNASGKTMLVDIITGRHPLLMNEPKYDFRPSTHEQASENIKYIAFFFYYLILPNIISYFPRRLNSKCGLKICFRTF